MDSGRLEPEANCGTWSKLWNLCDWNLDETVEPGRIEPEANCGTWGIEPGAYCGTLVNGTFSKQ